MKIVDANAKDSNITKTIEDATEQVTEYGAGLAKKHLGKQVLWVVVFDRYGQFLRAEVVGETV